MGLQTGIDGVEQSVKIGRKDLPNSLPNTLETCKVTMESLHLKRIKTLRNSIPVYQEVWDTE